MYSDHFARGEATHRAGSARHNGQPLSFNPIGALTSKTYQDRIPISKVSDSHRGKLAVSLDAGHKSEQED